MKKAILFFFTVIGCCWQVKAQENFITYKNDTEKALINSAQTPDDYIKLALASELDENEADLIYNKFIQDIGQLKLESTAGDKPEKRVNKIYQLVHAAFLKDYEPNAKFVDMLINGTYEGVDASILYAYILEKQNIPYQIKQLPGHVYVIAYPGSNKIQLETIDPAKGFFVFTDDSKQKDVIELIKGKYIEQSYAERVGVEQAFDEFFYSKPEISLKEALGLLYFNRAMAEMQTDKSNEAYSDFCKSDILFPDKKNEFFKKDLMTSLVYNFAYDDLKDWQALTRLVNDPNASADLKKFLQFKFDDMLNTKLLKEGQKDKVDEVHNYLDSNLADTVVRKQLEEDYWYENANYSFITNDYPKALDDIEKDYNLNPNNPVVVSQFVQLLQQNFSGQNGSVENMNLLDKYTTKYPVLLKNPVISSLYIYNISYLGYFAYVREDGVTGEKYLKLLIHELDTYPDHNDKYNMQIANVFAKASEYYFRKQGRQKCIDILNTGLKYVPDSEILLRKLKVNSQ